MPEFKVGYLGRRSFGRSRFPWTQYLFGVTEQWGELRIEEAWDDLSGGAKGIILTVWDATRLLWFVSNQGLPDRQRKFLHTARKFERWGYFMQDAEGVQPGRLPMTCAEVFSGYDRVLMASKWAYKLTKATINLPDLDWIPHGINTGVFKPQDRLHARSAWGVDDKAVVVGCVMSNQERKYWPVVLEAIARMPGEPKLWLHTDTLLNYWNLNALAAEYGLVGERILCENRQLSDPELAMRYSACDATVVISGGEGFCYPVAESLSCNVPAVTGAYGAAAELTPWLVPTVGTHIDTIHNVRRAYYDPETVTVRLNEIIAERPPNVSWLVDHLEWGGKLEHVWRKWVRKGLK